MIIILLTILFEALDLCMYVVLSYIYVCISTYNKYADKYAYSITETCTCDMIIYIVHFIYLQQ